MASESTSSQQSSQLSPSSNVNFKCEDGIIAFNNAVQRIENTAKMMIFMCHVAHSVGDTWQPDPIQTRPDPIQTQSPLTVDLPRGCHFSSSCPMTACYVAAALSSNHYVQVAGQSQLDTCTRYYKVAAVKMRDPRGNDWRLDWLALDPR
ncbi:hypothetical protein Tco_0242568 [Tanacetum coccineum]